MPLTRRSEWFLVPVLSLLAGCANSYFVPMELAPSKITATPLGSEPVGSPTLHVITHADGLGWQVTASQEWTEREAIAEQEYWRGLVYRRADNGAAQVGYTAATVITCPGSVLAHVFIRMFRIMGLVDRAEPTWRHVKGLCIAPLLGFDPSSGSWEERPGPGHEATEVQRRVTKPVTDGRVQIRWTHARWDAVGAEYPLNKRAAVDVRLREVGTVLLRTHDSTTLRQGQFELALLTPNGGTVRESLPISLSTVTAALESDLVRQPLAQWPTPLRVRIDAQDPRLATLAQQVLTELRIPVVTRGSSAAPLQAAQGQEVSPLFDDGQRPTIGHWTGANVVLSLTSVPVTSTTQFISVSASAIETGLLLGQFSQEGPSVTAPEVASAVRGQLALLMTPDGPAPRRGTLIEERRP